MTDLNTCYSNDCKNNNNDIKWTAISIPNNIQLVCSRVNILKHSLSEDLLYWWCKNIIEYKENDR